MALIGYPHSFLNGLSDFWQRFFVDAPQLDALYQGTAVLIGQAYLDLLSNVIGVSLKDTPIYAKEFYKLITLREDQLAFEWGASASDDRWVAALPDDVVAFLSLDNRVIEPTASLQERLDYDIDLTAKTIRFLVDPTDPNGDGTPLPGFARRALDIAIGGTFDDTARGVGESWMSRDVFKGDTLRLLDVGADLVSQRKRTDHTIVLVRQKAVYVDSTEPLTASVTPQNFVILRRSAGYLVESETMAFVGDEAQLANTRIDEGSVRAYAKTLGGADVVEGVDYTVDYEHGILYRNSSTWDPATSVLIDYTWLTEVWPAVGAPPRYSATGVIRSAASTARVVQMALWAPDAYVDRRTLANNFGTLIGREEDSSENYRAFLRGIFQLYLLGPVLERIESAINVIVGFPVIRDDGEILVDVDTSDPLVNRVTTRRAANNILNVYEFPTAAPLRADLIAANYETLTFEAFEPLTTAVTVTDYIQSPNWWHNVLIPTEMFSEGGVATIPTALRRTVSSAYVEHVVNPADGACVGDPGLVVGADENGFSPAPGHPVFRHRLAYVLMDRYLKFHTFIVRFDPSIFSLTDIGYTRSFNDLNELVLTAKPAHTYVFTQPLTDFYDVFTGADGDYWYQPASSTLTPDGPEFFLTEGEVTTPAQPYTQLGIFFNFTLASPVGGVEQILSADPELLVGSTVWSVGDFFRYEENLVNPFSFPDTVTPVVVGGAPPPDTTYRLVRVLVGGAIGGRALVENVDYTVDYGAMSILRITAWDSLVNVPVSFVFLSIGNLATTAPNPAAGDTTLTVGGQDPSVVRAEYDPARVNWLGQAQPTTNHQDISLVDRPLMLTVT
jgi:hypothetical protein